MHRAVRASRLFNLFLKGTLGLFLKLRFNVTTVNHDIVRRLRPPFVVLPNHFTNWDPFILGYFLPGPVHNVTTDAVFRSRIMRVLHRLVGSIPKSKVIPDVETIKSILEIKRQRGIIGIYPEGKRSWDGHTTDISIATAKLLRLLKVPVVVAISKGAYLSLPRWTHQARRGRIFIDFSLLFDGDDLRSLPVDEIYGKIVHALEYDEFDFQRGQMFSYPASRPAENLELALFLCPRCEAIASMRSKGDEFRCTGCGYGVRYDEHGFFRAIEGPLRFDNAHAWNLWQQERLKLLLEGRLADGRKEPIFHDESLKLYVGYRVRPPKLRGRGSMALHPESVEFRSSGGEPFSFSIAEIEGINVQVGERLEFYYRNVLYRVAAEDSSVSAFKWMSAIDILKGLIARQSAAREGG